MIATVTMLPYDPGLSGVWPGDHYAVYISFIFVSYLFGISIILVLYLFGISTSVVYIFYHICLVFLLVEDHSICLVFLRAGGDHLSPG